jgi:hypothetical protein
MEDEILDTTVPYNLKLKKSVRDDMKRQTHKRGTSIQSVLSAFCESYLNDPDKFTIKLEVLE